MSTQDRVTPGMSQDRYSGWLLDNVWKYYLAMLIVREDILIVASWLDILVVSWTMYVGTTMEDTEQASKQVNSAVNRSWRGKLDSCWSFTSLQLLVSYHNGSVFASMFSHGLLGNKAADTMTWYPTQSHYPNTELTCPFPILFMPITWFDVL